jgi:hypothetical protein
VLSSGTAASDDEASSNPKQYADWMDARLEMM